VTAGLYRCRIHTRTRSTEPLHPKGCAHNQPWNSNINSIDSVETADLDRKIENRPA
jgi:hypothetical protein